jgi:transposase InsO family protein
MPDGESRNYLFVAIDRATRWVSLHIYGDMTDKSSVGFLRQLTIAAPIKITKILTDNGSQLTDRFLMKDRTPNGQHAFDKVCAGMDIEHRLGPPHHPQTSGMMERFNGRISELLKQTGFDSRAISRLPCSTTLSCTTTTFSSAPFAQNANSSAEGMAGEKAGPIRNRVYDQTRLDTLHGARQLGSWEAAKLQVLSKNF